MSSLVTTCLAPASLLEIAKELARDRETWRALAQHDPDERWFLRLAAHDSCRIRVALRARLRRAAPVRVVPEGRQLRGTPGALQPPLLVLARSGVRRPKQRRDHESRGPPLQQALEGAPDRVVERSLDVA